MLKYEPGRVYYRKHEGDGREEWFLCAGATKRSGKVRYLFLPEDSRYWHPDEDDTNLENLELWEPKATTKRRGRPPKKAEDQ